MTQDEQAKMDALLQENEALYKVIDDTFAWLKEHVTGS
jgi:hypothetical protein